VVPETTHDTDVRAHTHSADHPQGRGNPWHSGPESASARVTRDARVIPIRREVRQEPPQDQPAPRKATGGLSAEMQAATAAVKNAAENSDWAAEAMTPVAAWMQVAPRRGEADNWIIWAGMTAAGIARGVLVSLGYLVVRGGETRLRAGVAAGILILAMAAAFLAGHTG
jgi:hypothetical protein